MKVGTGKSAHSKSSKIVPKKKARVKTVCPKRIEKIRAEVESGVYLRPADEIAEKLILHTFLDSKCSF